MALKQNIIYIYFKGKHQVTSKSQYQYNRGQYLYFADLNLPQAFEVHFSNKDKGESKTQIGSDNLVEILDEYFWSGALQIYAWIYLHSGKDDGETVYEIRIPLTKRAKPTDEEPLPQQQGVIDRTIAELNNAVDITTENADKTNADKTQVATIKEEVVTLKEGIDSTASAVSQDAQSARESADASKQSAQNSAESERKALDYSDEAKDYAQSALESKNTASQKAQVASDASAKAKDFRDEAETFKNEAEQAKQNIVDYRDETKGYRDETLTAKNDVQTIKGDVQSLKTQIDETATDVAINALDAKSSADLSYRSAISADNASLSALQSADEASDFADSASQSANQAEEFKNQSATNVTHYPKVIDGFWYVWDASNEIYVNTNVDARGIKGDKGDVGDTGNGIESAVLNSDYTLTITFTDGTSYTTPSIRGEKGIKGDVGNGIASTVLNNDYTLTINFTDGTQYTTPPIRGKQGDKGDKGDKGDTGATGAKGEQGERGLTGADGYSPTVTITPITGGHRITITDADGEHSADVMDGTGNVDDVQINGQSIVSDGVANVPIGLNKVGVVQITGNPAYGLNINGNTGAVTVAPANDAEVKAGTLGIKPIAPQRQHMSTFYGLAKSAGDTTQSASSNAVGNYTEDAKSKISEMLNGSVSVSGTTPTIVAKSGIRYVCGEVATLDFTPSQTGICDVVFTSGATATVLTVPNTVRWANGFDPTALETNTTYELNIMDGLGVACAWA